VKQDILSLFSSAPPPAPAPQSSLFGAPQQHPQMQNQSLVGSGGAAMWGADSWSSGAAAIPPAMAGANVWATPQMQYSVCPLSTQSKASNPRLTLPHRIRWRGCRTCGLPLHRHIPQEGALTCSIPRHQPNLLRSRMMLLGISGVVSNNHYT
jgi:hypothetical protein